MGQPVEDSDRTATPTPDGAAPDSDSMAMPAPDGAKPDLTILCITGWCRNGSTILGNVLNEVPGFFHVGEIHCLWKNSAGLGVR